MTHSDTRIRLDAAVKRHLGSEFGIGKITRLTGGAASTTLRFELESAEQSRDLILRLAQGGAQISTGIEKRTEARVLQHALDAGVPVPAIEFVLDEGDELGEGFAMQYVDGESIPQKILRDEAYQPARERLTDQCGKILATIHACNCNDINGLPSLGATEQLERYDTLYRQYREFIPAFEMAFRWLRNNTPELERQQLVHGDFRIGNFLVAPDEGIRSVLDWELAHSGDGMEDLGWLCVNSWRFGQRDLAVGGFGQRAELFAAYEKYSGVSVDPKRVRFWEIFGTLKWGIMCLYLTSEHLDGKERSVERAAIGRRVSETEIDLLVLLQETGRAA